MVKVSILPTAPSILLFLLQQGLIFSRPRANFILAYRHAGCNVINEDSILKLHDSSLKLLLTYYYKQVRIPKPVINMMYGAGFA
jgi:hypothetical protein